MSRLPSTTPWMWVAVVVCLVSVAPPIEAADPAQIEAARARGIAWLMERQAEDGSWRSAPGAEVATTAAVLGSLRRLGGGGGFHGYSYTAAVTWLVNAPVLSLDSQARRVMALRVTGANVDGMLAHLLQSRNALRSWGTYPRFDTSIPDTALALGAMRYAPEQVVEADVDAALCALLTAQKTSVYATAAGSWALASPVPFVVVGTPAMTSGTESVTLATVLSLLEIKATAEARGWAPRTCSGSQYNLAMAIDRALDWLLAQRRNADGGFGEQGVSSVFETALAYRALAETRPADPATMGALDHLLSRQAADGSWNGDAFQTASVLEVFPLPGSVIADSDWDGVPNVVEVLLGTNPNAFDSRWLARNSVNPTPSSGVTPPPALPSLVQAVLAAVLEGPAGDGDLNLDGVVDAADIAIAERIALGQLLATAEQLSHGDIAPAGARDGVIDVADVARIRRRVLRLEGP